jgi:drug/metabolite transporter (DMT)-like permease
VPIIEPVLNPTWAFIFVGETPGLWAIIGGAIILPTVAIWAVFRKRLTP